MNNNLPWSRAETASGDRLASSMEELARIIRERKEELGNVELGGVRRIYSGAPGTFSVPANRRRIVTYISCSGTPGAGISFLVDGSPLFSATIPADGHFLKRFPIPLFGDETITLSGGSTWYLVGVRGEDLQ